MSDTQDVDPNVGVLVAPPAGFSDSESDAALRQDRGGVLFPLLPAPQPAFVSRFALEINNSPHNLDRSADSQPPVNVLVPFIPNPMVRPFVRLFQQWAGPWGAAFMRAEGQRNISGRVTKQDHWAANGCFPTCQAMVMRWWAEDNPSTAGKLNWPGTVTKDPLDPPELCRRLIKGNKGFVPCFKTNAPKAPDPAALNDPDPAKQKKAIAQQKAHDAFIANRTKDGHDDPSVEWSVGDDMRQAIKKVTRNDLQDPVTGGPLASTHGRVKLGMGKIPPPGSSEDAKTADLLIRSLEIKFRLHTGPVIALMDIPGHFVVIDGYRGHTIYVCDPGNIMVNSTHWKTRPRPRDATERPPNDQREGYFALNDQAKFESANGTFNDPWLLQVSSIDVTFGNLLEDFHAEFSDPNAIPLPT